MTRQAQINDIDALVTCAFNGLFKVGQYGPNKLERGEIDGGKPYRVMPASAVNQNCRYFYVADKNMYNVISCVSGAKFTGKESAQRACDEWNSE